MSWSTVPPEDREEARRLRALAREVLTPPQLQAFELHEAGWGYRRISALLGCSPSAARDRLEAAERRLRTALEAEARP